MGLDNIVPAWRPGPVPWRVARRAGPILDTIAASAKRFLRRRATPAMATGAANHVWNIAEIGAPCLLHNAI